MVWYSNWRMHISTQYPVEGLTQRHHFHVGDGGGGLRDSIKCRIHRQPSRIMLIITARLAGNGIGCAHF